MPERQKRVVRITRVNETIKNIRVFLFFINILGVYKRIRQLTKALIHLADAGFATHTKIL
jgi:hypothetical protein